MDLEEVYLRQIDQKLKRQNELQEENNELLKELLKALSKQDRTLYGWIALTLNLIPSLPFEEQPDNLSVEDIIKGEVEYSQWQDRDRMWWANKK